MNSITKRSQRDYSLSFKLSVVDQVEKGEMTYTQAQDRYGIQGRSTVLVWLRKHGKLDWSQGSSSQQLSIQSMSDQKLPLTPEQKIKLLEQELAETRIKANFFEAVVEVMERDHGVALSKKQLKKSLYKRKSKD
jgi:transposase-like protein